jgi:hypothetical protein
MLKPGSFLNSRKVVACTPIEHEFGVVLEGPGDRVEAIWCQMNDDCGLVFGIEFCGIFADAEKATAALIKLA